MTISAQVPDRDQLNPSLGERPTHRLSAKHPCVVDSFALLDHRTQERAIPAVGAAPGRYLAFEDGAVTNLIALERPITHIGRGLIADVRLEDSHVSRRHAILALRGEGARVLDDRSSNGTFVNGRAVTVAHLSDGDVLRFGRAVFRYTEIAPPGRTRPLRRIPLARGTGRPEPAGTAKHPPGPPVPRRPGPIHLGRDSAGVADAG